MQADEITKVYQLGGLAGLTALAAGVLAAAYLVTWAKKNAEAIAGRAVAKELETHRVQLQLSADAARLDIQRQLHDFTLYSSKRMDAYEKVYRTLIRAEGAAGAHVGLSFQPDYSRASVDQIRSEFAEFNLPDEELAELLALWGGDRKRAMTMLDQLKRRVLLGRAQRLYDEARNERLLVDLYLSPEVSAAVDAAMPKIWKLIGAQLFPDAYEGSNLAHMTLDAAGAVIEARNAMQRDLARGDYGRTLVSSLSVPA